VCTRSREDGERNFLQQLLLIQPLMDRFEEGLRLHDVKPASDQFQSEMVVAAQAHPIVCHQAQK